ncbi:class I adenylate-forming enzyme family protein [Cohnella cholangitidis]|uniref:Acyl--CoA ligase n=1 Tax=Cohnella cholangitidis TaxID=2598458 RepID=A0A7G5BUG8_9BACL|nr:class I adenylate-forming enzyme family protein [Cohnella cholangitidis]QMV40602.1 acyl--CoA ligase [Cohnella cholangitidis]
MNKLVYGLLQTGACKDEDKTALLSEFSSYTYRELLDEVDGLANELAVRGVRKGDRVVALLADSVESVFSIFAISKIGAVFVHLNVEIVSANLKYIIEDCGPKIIITNDRFIDKFELNKEGLNILNLDALHADKSGDPLAADREVSIDEEDIACLIYTSGSTGKPKAVISSHSNVTFVTDAIQKCLEIRASDIIATYIPFSFDYGLYQIFLSCHAGATLFIGNKKNVGSTIMKDILKWKITGLPIVPSMVNTLVALAKRETNKIEGLRFITSTGSSFAYSNILDLIRIFGQCDIYAMYGLTECKRVSILPCADVHRKINSIGKPLPGTQCCIVDQTGNELPPNEIGELVVKGPHVMQGYWNNEPVTNQFYRRLNDERVLFTGDYCSMDEEGYLYFYGRKDDIFKHNGYRLSTLEIEGAALEVKGVTQAVFIPLGEDEPSYLLVVSPNTIDNIREELALKLESYKMPHHIVKVMDLPLTPHGKIDKLSLKKTLSEGTWA